MQTSESFNRKFLLLFTTELIKHSNSAPFFEIQSQLKEEEEEIKRKQGELKRKLLEKIKEHEEKQMSPEKKFKPLPQTFKVATTPRILKIPEPKLPAHLQYLKPLPTNQRIDLGNLNSLIKDPNIEVIECNHSDEPVVVRGRIGIKNSSISLSEEEITEILEKFFSEAKIPYSEGIHTIAVGNLKLSAIISGDMGSKFIITKIR